MRIRLHSPEALMILERDRTTPTPCPCCGQQPLHFRGQYRCPDCGLAAPYATPYSKAIQEWNDLCDLLEGNP